MGEAAKKHRTYRPTKPAPRSKTLRVSEAVPEERPVPGGLKRVHVTVPDEWESLLGWYVKYDPRFNGNAAQAVAHFLGVGLEAEYALGIRQADPLDASTRKALAASQAQALRATRDDE